LFGAEIGAGEEALGAGGQQLAQHMANIQNLHDEASVNEKVTQNFKDIDMMNGRFMQQSGDVQGATVGYHIDNMRRAVVAGSEGMSLNQRLLYNRQTEWNLRAQISRAVTSADSSMHAYTKQALIAGFNNDLDHAIRNIDNDALWHLDLQSMNDKYNKVAVMDNVPAEVAEFNRRKQMDIVAGKMVRSLALGPRQDVEHAQKVLDSMAGPDKLGLSFPVQEQLQDIIDKQTMVIDSRHWTTQNTPNYVPAIGSDSSPDGAFVNPGSPPTEPIPPAAPAPQHPEIRSEIDPAQDALNRGDYLAYGAETYRPHAPKVQLAALPREMTRDLPARGGAEVTSAIDDASQRYGLDPGTMRAIASIESDNKPESNRRATTQYKGLFQIGKDEWRRYGEGDIYNPRDNAMAAARMIADHKAWFRERYGRNPSDAELYMMHQQGRGFFSRGAMTNIQGNRYPGMRGSQSRASFQQGWANELQRRKMLLAEQEAGA
jgi:hypothetical protein